MCCGGFKWDGLVVQGCPPNESISVWFPFPALHMSRPAVCWTSDCSAFLVLQARFLFRCVVSHPASLAFYTSQLCRRFFFFPMIKEKNAILCWVRGLGRGASHSALVSLNPIFFLHCCELLTSLRCPVVASSVLPVKNRCTVSLQGGKSLKIRHHFFFHTMYRL